MSKLDTNQIHLNNNVADLRQHQLRAAAKNTWRLIFPDISGDLFAGNTINNKNIQTHATIFLQRLFPPLGESFKCKDQANIPVLIIPRWLKKSSSTNRRNNLWQNHLLPK